MLEPITYTVTSSGELDVPDSPPDQSAERSVIDPAIAAYVRQAGVCGTDALGQPLARYPTSGNHIYDHQIAANIEQHLRSKFTYTTDLTNLGSLGDRDPLAAFLTDFKRGHCEYFAGAMTLMCQSLNIPAHLVVGFRCIPRISTPWATISWSSSPTRTRGVRFSRARNGKHSIPRPAEALRVRARIRT